MLVKGLSRVFSKINLCPNPKSYFRVNLLGYRNRFYFHNIYGSANVDHDKLFRFSTDDIKDVTFREYIEKNNNFRSSVFDFMNLNFTVDDKYESLKLLVKLKENAESSDLWREMIECFKKEVKTFEVEDILKAVVLASEININEDSEDVLSQFITYLDDELKIRRLKIDEILEILFVLRHTLFMGKSLKRLRFYFKTFRSFQKLSKFEPQQATHLYYYLEKISETVISEHKYPLLKYTQDILPQLEIDQMAIILAALFRSKLFKVDVHFIQQIINKVLDKIDSVKSIHLFYICKFLQGCSSTVILNAVLDFQEKLIPYVSKFNSKSLISALYSNYPVCLNLSLWNNVIEKVKTELKVLPFVDIERMVNITTTFKVENNEEFLKLAIEAIEERPDHDKYFPHFVNFSKNLAIHRIYPKKFLDLALSKDFIENMLMRSFSKEVMAWAFLNHTLQIDKPEYQCKCLSAALEKKIMKKIFAFRILGKPDIGPPRLKDRLYKSLRATFGGSAVTQTYCLPHLEKGAVMRFDQNLNATELPRDFRFGSTKLVKAPSDNHFWVVIYTSVISAEGLNPLQETYIRHLTAFGYKPILVGSDELYQNEKLGINVLDKYLEDVILKALEKMQQEQKTTK